MKNATLTQTALTAKATTNAIYTKFSKWFLVVLTYFSPINFVFVIIGSALVVDTIAGRWAAKHVARREGKDVRLEVTSKKTREGFVIKAITYNVMILSLYAIDKNILNAMVFYWFPQFPIDFIITKAFGFVIALIEYDSIDEKYYIVRGTRLKTQITDKVKGIKKTLISVFKFTKELKELKDGNK